MQVTSTILSLGSMAYKGYAGLQAGKEADREAGLLRQKELALEEQALADLEQNRLDSIQAPMEVFDRANEFKTLDGSTILESAAEGDTRGVSATAGKIKATQDLARSQDRDALTKIKLDIDTKAAIEGNRKGELVSTMKDTRGESAGIESKLLQQEADTLTSTGMDALGSAALGAVSALTPAFNSDFKKAAEALQAAAKAKGETLSDTDALAQAKAFAKFDAEDAAVESAEAEVSTIDKIGNAVNKVGTAFGIGDGKDFGESKVGGFLGGIGDKVSGFLGGFDWASMFKGKL